MSEIVQKNEVRIAYSDRINLKNVFPHEDMEWYEEPTTGDLVFRKKEQADGKR